MERYELIAIGSGSAMSVVSAFMERHPGARVAVIDKDEPGGICLTRGCIPSKILLYPAEVIRVAQRAREFGVECDVRGVRFDYVMDRMRTLIGKDIASIREGLSHTPNLDYFDAPAEFVAPYTLRVKGTEITAPKILLGTGSRPSIPPVPGLDHIEYLTSDTVLQLRKLPPRLAVLGGGYIAAEYGHFFAAMGSEVTIVGRNPQFLPAEEPEVSRVARTALGTHLTIVTNAEVMEVSKGIGRAIHLTVRDRATGGRSQVVADALLVAAGREPTSDLLHPERAGVATEPAGWIRVNEYLETSQPGIWALGDATGVLPFKHKANYDAKVVYHNLVVGERRKVDYRGVPHAVFTYPEVAGVGLREHEAVEKFGADKLLVGTYRYEDTAKGEAMGVHDYFVKVVVERESKRLLGAHIVGPEASILLQEVVTLMWSSDPTATPIRDGMHIHPALSEVVERAFLSLRPPGPGGHVHAHAA